MSAIADTTARARVSRAADTRVHRDLARLGRGAGSAGAGLRRAGGDAAGHTDGPPLPEGDSIPLLVDALEAMLDEVGWPDAYLVGFSLGGWLSLELAKRGRARTVTAVSPGGGETQNHDRESRRIRCCSPGCTSGRG